ncbi:MAG: hypothetical protein V7K89_00585 [Nostoc sp.]|uniref:hypothetical protein n=1 Tax=Nostoc sp. TaxID=1180 RepID=UPI002FFAEDD8
MLKTLTENQLNRYQQDGVLFPISILSFDEATRYLTLSNQLGSLLKPQSQPVEMSIQMHLFFR